MMISLVSLSQTQAILVGIESVIIVALLSACMIVFLKIRKQKKFGIAYQRQKNSLNTDSKLNESIDLNEDNILIKDIEKCVNND